MLVSQIKAEPITLVFLIFLEVAVQGPLVLVLFGVFAGSSSALYATALIINLLQVSFMLGRLVLSRPDTAA